MTKRLNLTVDLNSDDELRSYIKQMIDDQVKSIIREEFRELIREKISDILTNKKNYDKILLQAVNTIAEREVRNSINRIISDEKPRNYFSFDGHIKSTIDEKINSAIKDVLNKVDIEKIMKNRSENIVKQVFENMIKK